MTVESIRQTITLLEGIEDLPDFDEIDREKHQRTIRSAIKRAIVPDIFRQLDTTLSTWEGNIYALWFKVPPDLTSEKFSVNFHKLANHIDVTRIGAYTNISCVFVENTDTGLPKPTSGEDKIKWKQEINKFVTLNLAAWLHVDLKEVYDDNDIGWIAENKIWWKYAARLSQQVNSAVTQQILSIKSILNMAKSKDEFAMILDELKKKLT